MDLTRGVNPFNRHDWHGRLVSLDGADTSDFTEADLAAVVASGADDDRWDGTVAAVLQLKDGRFCCYETFFGPTGDGFFRDAYGGNADLSFGMTLGVVVRMGLTDDGRRLCDIPVDHVAAMVWEREWLDAQSSAAEERPAPV